MTMKVSIYLRGKEKLFKGFLKLFIKWFLDSIWPEIKEMLKYFVVDFIKWVFQRLKDFIEKNNQSQSDMAKEKAEQAEQKAKEATNAEEAIRYRGQAEAYREMYNELSRSHEKMRTELEELKTEIYKTAEDKVNNLSAENVFDMNPVYGKGNEIKFNPMLLLSNEE